MEIVAIGVLTLLASFVGTLAGFGSSTIMLPIIIPFFPYEIALLLVGIIHFFDDVWEIMLFRQAANWKLLLSFGIPGILASFIGAKLVIFEPQNLLIRLLGGVLLFYVFLIIKKPRFEISHKTAHTRIGGFLSGFMAGIFGLGGAIRALFLSSFNLSKETYLFTSGAIAIFIDPVRLLTYFRDGARLTGNLSWEIFIFIAISFVGSRLAKAYVDKISQEKFKKIVGIFLFLAGLKLLIFP